MCQKKNLAKPVALLLVLVLSCRSEFVAPALGAPKVRWSPHIVPAVPVLAAAAAILSIASSIKGFFDAEEQKRTQEDILNKLNEIKGQLAEIDSKMDVVIARFDELEFHIDQQFERQRKIDVITAIKRINQHYPTWTSRTYRRGSNPAVPDPAAILEELRRATTALRETPSFANYPTVALAMGYEHLLLTRVFHVKENDADMQRGFEQYAVYFRNAAGPTTISGVIPVGFRWNQANVDWNTFRDAFSRRPTPLRCDAGAICCEHPQNWWYTGRHFYRYQGDLLSGFTVVAEESNLMAGPGGVAAMACRNSEHPLYPRLPDCPHNIGTVPAGPCDLDQQHATAVAKKQAVDDLTAAMGSLKAFNSQAENWAGIAPDKTAFPQMPTELKIDVEMQKRLEENPTLSPPPQ